jgi:phosphoribosylformylglycinamidine synthase
VTYALAHGEGAYVAEDAVIDELEQDGRVAFRYCDAAGEATDAANPNGSIHNIAGVYSAGFNVLGLMPHPENLVDALTGGIDGRPLFEGLAAA